MWDLVLVPVLALAGLVACAPAPGRAPPPGPAIYEAALWPARPVVESACTIAPDLRTTDGRETVVFTPDLPVCELVFRAWPNTLTMFRTGTALAVTDTSVDGRPTTARIHELTHQWSSATA